MKRALLTVAGILLFLACAAQSRQPKGIIPGNYTTVEMLAIESPKQGQTIYNTQTNTLWSYDYDTLTWIDQDANTGGGGSVTVDPAIADGSTNPVTNNAVFDRFATTVDEADNSPDQIKMWRGTKAQLYAIYGNPPSGIPSDTDFLVTDSIPAGSEPADMFKIDYDSDDDGAVNDSEQLNGQNPSFYLDNATHTGEVTGSAALTISNNAITSNKIANGAVATEDLSDGAVNSTKIVDGGVAAADIANSAVNSSKIANGAVATEDLADGAATTAKIGNNQVTEAKIADDAITTDKIADSQVTQAKLANSSINSAKIADNTINGFSDIQDESITAFELATNSVTTSEIANNTIVTEDINVDFFQTGSFTPTIHGLSSGTYTSSFASGSYVRVGKLCIVTVYISGLNGTTPTGALEVRGLPFNSANDFARGSVQVNNSSVSFYSIYCWSVSGTGNVRFNYQNSLDGSTQVNTYTNVDFTNGILGFSLTFITE
ncbi:MAG: hypothetical protein AAF634_11610 [Bacteroidota bacterium]